LSLKTRRKDLPPPSTAEIALHSFDDHKRGFYLLTDTDADFHAVIHHFCLLCGRSVSSLCTCDIAGPGRHLAVQRTRRLHVRPSSIASECVRLRLPKPVSCALASGWHLRGTMPAGFTYDMVQSNLNVCSASNFAISYRLRTPQDNIYACTVPGGFTYDRVQSNLNVCSASSFAISYHVRVPANGLWACTVPAGFSYDSTQNNLNVCSASGFAYSYRLRR
jgi:hypothetical protein